MTRWLPHPVMAAALMAIWLLLNQSLAPGHLLLGALFGAALSALVGRLDLPPIRIQRPHLLVLLAGRVARDIVRSNIAVLTIILAGRDRQITSGFVRVPLRLGF